MSDHPCPVAVAILIDIDSALDGTENPYYSKFIAKNFDKMGALGIAIAFFLRKERDFMVLHLTPYEANRLGYFEREDCLIFDTWGKAQN